MPDRSSIKRDIPDSSSVRDAKRAGVVDGMEKNHATKDPAAVALGRLGGKKGGKARAAKLTAAQRSEIARRAAAARWASRGSSA